MGRFYFDTEYTNGNYYIGDIFEIAIVAEESGNVYHSYVHIDYKIPPYLKSMCNITDVILKEEGDAFNSVFNALISFIKFEEKNDGIPTLIAHGEHHFPLLLANCLKNKCDISFLKQCNFIDSAFALRNGTNRVKCSLDALCMDVLRKHITHSAIGDVLLLKHVLEREEIRDVMKLSKIYSFFHLTEYLNAKLPVSFDEMKMLAENSEHIENLCFLLWTHVRKYSSLNEKHVYRIASIYFKKKYHA